MEWKTRLKQNYFNFIVSIIQKWLWKCHDFQLIFFDVYFIIITNYFALQFFCVKVNWILLQTYLLHSCSKDKEISKHFPDLKMQKRKWGNETHKNVEFLVTAWNDCRS